MVNTRSLWETLSYESHFISRDFIFLINTHLYPTSLTTLGIWTIGPNTSHFSNEYNFFEIYSFHFLPVFSILTFIHGFYFEILIISYDVNSHLEIKYIVNDKSTSTPFFSIYKLIIEISSLLGTYTFFRS